MKRVPEPELMDNLLQVEGFNSANRDYSLNAVVYWFKQFCGIEHGLVIDLGCGPARGVIKLAQSIPGIKILGIDGSYNMIQQARINVNDVNLENRVGLLHSTFDKVEPIVCSCVMSVGTLHHLHDPSVFWNAVKQLALPGTFIFIVDIVRPENEIDILTAMDTLIKDENEFFRNDFYNSMRAAYTRDEIEQQLADAGLHLTINVQRKENAGEMIFLYGKA